MTDVYGGPFGTYLAAAGVVDGTGKDEIAAGMTSFAALLGITLTAGNGVTGAYVLDREVPNPHPDFDAIRPEMRDKIGLELAEMWDAIDAASEA